MENTILKYPRTPHLPSSPGCTNDDKRLSSFNDLRDGMYIITEKMDGENTTMMRDRIYARSLDSNNHPSRNYVKGIWGQISYKIPKGYRICGENLYAKHSIHYKNLTSYFQVISIWDGNNNCIDFSETITLCNWLGLKQCPFLGMISKEELQNYKPDLDWDNHEGFVARHKDTFHYDDFQHNVAKWVRPQHVQTDEHWMNNVIIKNELKS